MMLKNKNILVCVCGGIAIYKVVDVVSRLKKEGADVTVVMTEAAKKFVTPLTFQAISQNKVYDDVFEDGDDAEIKHIVLAQRADLILIAPATANTMSKLSYGMADNMVTTTILASEAKKLLIPAMNTKMYINPITQENLQRLLGHGYEYMEPESGQMATKTEGSGIGRLPEPASIVDRVNEILTV